MDLNPSDIGYNPFIAAATACYFALTLLRIGSKSVAKIASALFSGPASMIVR